MWKPAPSQKLRPHWHQCLNQSIRCIRLAPTGSAGTWRVDPSTCTPSWMPFTFMPCLLSSWRASSCPVPSLARSTAALHIILLCQWMDSCVKTWDMLTFFFYCRLIPVRTSWLRFSRIWLWGNCPLHPTVEHSSSMWPEGSFQITFPEQRFFYLQCNIYLQLVKETHLLRYWICT